MLSEEIKMLIKKCANNLLVLIILFVCTFLCSQKMQAQVVWEDHTKEVYHYLSRMAQKGFIDFDDNIRPISRKYIGNCLDTLLQKTTLLSITEKKELSFYCQEYGNEISSNVDNLKDEVRFFKLDPYNRWRAFHGAEKNNLVQVDPVLTASTISGSGKNFTSTSSGVSFRGYIGKNWGFHFFFNDVTESGVGFDSTRFYTSGTGIIRKDTTVHSSQNFTQYRGSISYSWKKGSVSFGQDYLLWGYGQNGRIVLSDKTPTSPFIRLDYQFFPWLKFNYVHAWLNSKIIDSAQTYSTGNIVYGGQRVFYIPKYMATHSLQISASKWLSIALGESIIYSDHLEVGYLFPLMFFKVYDNIVNNSNISAGSNGQLFFQLSSRNLLPKTHLYSTVFIDEIRLSAIFDKNKSRNQLGFNVGGSITDVIIPYLTLGIEYTRVNPFVYSNLIPAQNYTSYNYSLGDWMGNNFDRIIYSLNYTPFPRFKCQIRYQLSRKGDTGTLNDQYFQQPQPEFLFNLQKKQQEFYTHLSYEWINNLTINAFYSSLSDENRVTSKKTTNNTFSIGFAYGL